MADSPIIGNKRIRSLPPDVTVCVGNGSTAQSFSCYKLALCFASSYFDAMLSSGMREDTTNTIKLPNKDPGEWKLFYSIIDPSQIGEVRNESCINESNAAILTPWFHEFQMEKHLKECDDVLANKVQELSNWIDKSKGVISTCFWEPDFTSGRQKFSELIDMLEHACKYDLVGTIQEAETTIGSLLRSHLSQCHHLFDIEQIRKLIQLCLPVVNNDGNRSRHLSLISDGPCKQLWANHLFVFISPRRSQITADMVNSNEMFPLLLHSYMEQTVLKQANQPSQIRARYRQHGRGSILARRNHDRILQRNRRNIDLQNDVDSSSDGSIRFAARSPRRDRLYSSDSSDGSNVHMEADSNSSNSGNSDSPVSD